MGTKWEWYGFAISAGATALMWLVLLPLAIMSGYAFTIISISVLLAALTVALIPSFGITRFDDSGFTVFNTYGKAFSCKWSDIEKVELHVFRDYSTKHHPAYRVLAIYTPERFLNPGDVIRKGNRKKSNYAWMMSNAFETKDFRRYLEHFRPDLYIERDPSSI